MPRAEILFFRFAKTTSSHILDARALGLARERTESGARDSTSLLTL
jgi:hypothetical protein